MNDEQFKELEANAEKLWQELQALEAPMKVKRLEWQAAWNQLNRETMRREILAEPKSNVESVGEKV